METLDESKRKYSNSEKVFNLYFGQAEKDYMHAEFQYDQRTKFFYISINSEFTIQFTNLPEDNSENDIQVHNDNVWCNYDFNKNIRYHIACKTIPIKDKLKHSFDSFELEFIVKAKKKTHQEE